MKSMKSRNVKIGLVAALSGLATMPGCNKSVIETAMCYIVAFEEYVDYLCSHCGVTIKGKHGNRMIFNIYSIDETVAQMKTLGYDVILDKTEFCPYCSKKNIENPELIFCIRFSDEVDYHFVRSNIINEYRCLLEFLSNPEEYTGNREIIQKMTGLGEDMKIN